MPDRFYDNPRMIDSANAMLTIKYVVKRERRRVIVMNGDTPLFPTFRAAREAWERLVAEGFRGEGIVQRVETIAAVAP